MGKLKKELLLMVILKDIKEGFELYIIEIYKIKNYKPSNLKGNFE